MTLGVAREASRDPRLRSLLDDAWTESRQARESCASWPGAFIRPCFGLVAAVEALAEGRRQQSASRWRSGAGRPRSSSLGDQAGQGGQVEAPAYFVICEAVDTLPEGTRVAALIPCA
jgi:hypothetical protein